jgi:hypothetical protein
VNGPGGHTFSEDALGDVGSVGVDAEPVHHLGDGSIATLIRHPTAR